MNPRRLFTEYPDAVGETYFEHMKVALSFAGPLSLAGFTAFVHAFLPFLFVTTASGTVKRLHARMVNRVPKLPIRREEGVPANAVPALDWEI